MSVYCDSYSSTNKKKAESMFKYTHTHTHPHFSHQWKPNYIKHLGSFSPCLKVRVEEINLREKEGAKSHWLHPQTPRGEKSELGTFKLLTPIEQIIMVYRHIPT